MIVGELTVMLIFVNNRQRDNTTPGYGRLILYRFKLTKCPKARNSYLISNIITKIFNLIFDSNLNDT